MRIEALSNSRGKSGPRRQDARHPVKELVDHPGENGLTLLDCRDARFWYPWHFHPEVEIKLIVAGQGTRYVGESITDFAAGDLCIVGPGTAHCWSSRPHRGKWVHARVVQFLPEIVQEFAGLFEEARLGLELVGDARGAASAELNALFDTSSTQQQLAHLRALLRLANDTRERRRLCLPREVSPMAAADRQLAQQIFAYLLRHAASPLRQSDVARHFGLSIAGFSRLFSREFGKPFVRYRAELRVGHASHLLMQEELSISQVARASGFGTVASLDRQFRSVKGTTPRDFRRLARQMNCV